MQHDIKIISVLGMVGHTKVDYTIKAGKIHKIFVSKKEEDKASYSFGPRLVNKYGLGMMRHFNMLPLLCELFGSEKIIPIYTQKSKKIQKELLNSEGYKSTFLENQDGFIENEKDFTAIFAQINKILQKNERIIVDITHGFRHLPVLATISLMIENIRDIDKIEHIFFAKEVEAFKRYEIIDLKEYLDVANVAFALVSFNTNYTVAHSIKCVDVHYQALIDILAEFSEHILSNSVIELIESEHSLIERILDALEKIDTKAMVGLLGYIQKIKLHLFKMKALKNTSKDEQLYALAKNMYEKGYYLNAITLLNEAVGYYGAKCFRTYDIKIAQAMDSFLENKDQKIAKYELVNMTKALIKNLEKTTGTYLDMEKQAKLSSGRKTALQKKKKKIKEQIPSSVMAELKALGLELEFKRKSVSKDKSLQQLIIKRLQTIKNFDVLQHFIVEIDNLRNNLAHANSSYQVSEIKTMLLRLLETYNELCKNDNILMITDKRH